MPSPGITDYAFLATRETVNPLRNWQDAMDLLTHSLNAMEGGGERGAELSRARRLLAIEQIASGLLHTDPHARAAILSVCAMVKHPWQRATG